MRVLVIIAIFSTLLSSTSAAQDKTAQIKAVFLFKFADYVKWPASNRLEVGGIFNLCVLGSHPFGNALDIIAAKQSKYKYNIVYVRTGQIPQNCHLAFFRERAENESETKALVVSDRTGFAGKGGMIEMVEDNGKVKLIINLHAAENEGFKISSRLLKIAEVQR